MQAVKQFLPSLNRERIFRNLLSFVPASLIRQIFIFSGVLGVICCQTACAENQPPINLHLVYTSNLNGALDDCRCGGNPVGGMNRVLPVLDSLRSAHPDMLLLDGGDFLMSYTLPEANRVMLNLMAIAGYDALNLGDQEFVESADFIREVSDQSKLDLKVLSANLDAGSRQTFHQYDIFEKADVKIAVAGLVMPEAFEFILVDDLTVSPVIEAMNQISTEMTADSDIQIVLFHGSWEAAKAVSQQFPWIDVIILAHNQQKKFVADGEIAFAECGTEGQYIGYLQIQKNEGRWEFKNQFIAINDDLLFSPTAQEMVDGYYKSLE